MPIELQQGCIYGKVLYFSSETQTFLESFCILEKIASRKKFSRQAKQNILRLLNILA